MDLLRGWHRQGSFCLCAEHSRYNPDPMLKPLIYIEPKRFQNIILLLQDTHSPRSHVNPGLEKWPSAPGNELSAPPNYLFLQPVSPAILEAIGMHWAPVSIFNLYRVQLPAACCTRSDISSIAPLNQLRISASYLLL